MKSFLVILLILSGMLELIFLEGLMNAHMYCTALIWALINVVLYVVIRITKAYKAFDEIIKD